MPSFDPYHKWLGIPPKDQPPNHYRLLGLVPFESDPDVVDAAASRQGAYLQGCATGPHVALSQKLLNEIAAARLCLLNPQKRAKYDRQLRATLNAKSQPAAQPKETRHASTPPSLRPETLMELPVADIGFVPILHGKKRKKWAPWMLWGVVGIGGLVVIGLLVLKPRFEQEIAKAPPPPSHKTPIPPRPPPTPPKPPKPKPNPESVKREGWLPLADTQEQFDKHWRMGNVYGESSSFDPTNKTINIDAPWNLGGLTCGRKWKDFYCEIDVGYLPDGKLDLTLKHESSASPASLQSSTFKLGDALDELLATASLRVTLDDKSGKAVVLLNDVQVGQPSDLDPKWMDSFDCTFSSGDDENAKLHLKNIHLLVESNDTEPLSDWTPPERNSPVAKQTGQQTEWQPAIYNVEIDPPYATLTVKNNGGVITGTGRLRRIRIDHAPSSGNVVIEAVCSGYESSEQCYAPEAGKTVDKQIHLKKLPDASAEETVVPPEKTAGAGDEAPKIDPQSEPKPERSEAPAQPKPDVAEESPSNTPGPVKRSRPAKSTTAKSTGRPGKRSSTYYLLNDEAIIKRDWSVCGNWRIEGEGVRLYSPNPHIDLRRKLTGDFTMKFTFEVQGHFSSVSVNMLNESLDFGERKGRHVAMVMRKGSVMSFACDNDSPRTVTVKEENVRPDTSLSIHLNTTYNGTQMLIMGVAVSGGVDISQKSDEVFENREDTEPDRKAAAKSATAKSARTQRPGKRKPTHYVLNDEGKVKRDWNISGNWRVESEGIRLFSPNPHIDLRQGIAGNFTMQFSFEVQGHFSSVSVNMLNESLDFGERKGRHVATVMRKGGVLSFACDKDKPRTVKVKQESAQPDSSPSIHLNTTYNGTQMLIMGVGIVGR